jgi:hypothetical protein
LKVSDADEFWFYGFRVSGFGFRISCFLSQVSGFVFRILGFGYSVKSLGLRVLRFGIQGSSGFWISVVRVSGIDVRAQDKGLGV